MREHGYRLEDFELQSSDATKRKAREDYTLVWQAKPGDPRNVGDAHYRLEVDIAGDQVVGFSRSFKLPEEWERAQEASTLVNNILMGVSVLTLLTLLAAGLILFVNLVRSGQMPWRRSLKFGVLLAVLGFLGALAGLPLADRNYDTSMPLTVWKLLIAVGMIVVPLGQGLLAWLLIGSAVSFYPDAWKLARASARRMWRRDALVVLVLSLAAGLGLARLSALLTSVFHAYAPIKDELFPVTFSTEWPAAVFFLSCLGRALMYAAMLGLLIHIVRIGLETPRVVAVGGFGAGAGFTGTYPRSLAGGIRCWLGDESVPATGGGRRGDFFLSRQHLGLLDGSICCASGGTARQVVFATEPVLSSKWRDTLSPGGCGARVDVVVPGRG